jgi:cell filamentation protein
LSATHIDPYCYPGTSVLRNLNDIRDPDRLAAFEASSVAFNIANLRNVPITGPFNLDRLRLTHRRIFEGVYPWVTEAGPASFAKTPA